MWDSTYQNFAQKFRWYAHFPANFPKFQIFLEQSIFVVQKRLVYEKTFIFDGEYDKIKIKYSQFDFDIDRTKNECFKAKKRIF